MAESADAPDSKSGGGNTVSVQIRSGAVSYLRQVVKTQPFHGWIVGSNPAGTTDWQISNTRPWNLSVIRFISGRTALQGLFFFCPIREGCLSNSFQPALALLSQLQTANLRICVNAAKAQAKKGENQHERKTDAELKRRTDVRYAVT